MKNIFKQLGPFVVVGLLIALAGIVAIFITNPVMGILVIPVLLLMGMTFWNGIFKPIFSTNRLLEIGIPAEATVKTIAETGSTIRVGGTMPKAGVRLLLEVRPKDKPAYQTYAEAYISVWEIANYQPGAVINVKFDPKDPSKVALTDITPIMSGYSAVNKEAMEKEMEKLVEMQNELLKHGVEAPAKVVEMQNTNINVNGDNPLLALKLEVQPQNAKPFMADVKAAVLRASMHKFVPGKQIWVKYDQRDQTRVAVSRTPDA